jgi:hypothetical protein
MAKFRKSFLFLLPFLFLAPASVRAEVVVAFYSHDFGTTFPHAFVKLEGKLDRDGTVVDTNYGFTAKSITAAMMTGRSVGIIEISKPKYVAGSDRQFAIRISDAQYDALIAHVRKWQSLPGKGYDLNRNNCVHFVGEVARIAGLKVELNPNLMKKPKGFLQSVIAMNPWVRGSNP